MKTLHIVIIIGITFGLSFWCPHFASAHIVPGFSIQPDRNYTDSITHYLSTKEGHPIIVIKQDYEFTLPMTLKSENDSLSTTYSFLVTNDTDFTHKVILPEILIHVVPDHFIIRHGGDQKFDIVIKTGKNTPSGIYTPNLVISWNNNVTVSKEIVGIPFQVGKWNWDSLSKQIESGRSAENVVCKSSDQIVIIKAEDNSPACVKPYTASKLVERGWATNMSQLKHVSHMKTNDPFVITALVIYHPFLGCLSSGCPHNNFYLKINSNSTAYLTGYNICNKDSCAKNNALSILLPINTILRNPNYASIELPESLEWKDGDAVTIQLEVSPNADNKTASLIDLGNSTIVP